ncbi:MAG: hypothetical protein A2W09_07455 [Deltaproteobacteria bacterium RBG_16_50_11]|nr:MAG: hypothetical protein A2W09_07455 [Deltaproteobacteria bacterium RBG_16_50_11]
MGTGFKVDTMEPKIDKLQEPIQLPAKHATSGSDAATSNAPSPLEERIACWAAVDLSWQASAFRGGIAILFTLRIIQESALATATLLHVLKRENSRNGNGT